MQCQTGPLFGYEDSCQSDCTPRGEDCHRRSLGTGHSPGNKKKRGRFYAIFGKSNAEIEENDGNHFELSQDDSNHCSFSQISEDFTERLGGLTVKASQDQCSSLSNDGNSFPFGSNANFHKSSKLNQPSGMKASQSRFYSNREVPPTFSSRRSSTESLQPPEINRRQISIAPAVENPFMRGTFSPPLAHRLKTQNKSS